MLKSKNKNQMNANDVFQKTVFSMRDFFLDKARQVAAAKLIGIAKFTLSSFK